MSLTQKASRSAFWNLFGSGSVSAIRFVSTAILARILLPEDFGIVGMAYLVTQVVQLFGNLGLGAAIVQKGNVDEEYLSTAFWGSVAVGFVLTIIGVGASPLAAMFFKREIVQPVVMCLSINFFLSSLASVQTMLLTKNLKFKELTIIEIIMTVFRVTVILALAIMGFRFWSIVFGVITERIVKTAVFYLRSEWRPRFVFVKEKFYELFKFGRNLYGANFLSYLNRNLDFIITGRILGATELGYYQFSFNVPHLVQTHLGQKVSQVLFPVYSKVKDDDKRLARGYLKTVTFITLITLPLIAGLAILAHEFIVTVYGQKWIPAVVPLQILCVAAALKSLAVSNSSLLMAKGRPDIFLKWGLFTLPLTALSIWFFSRWGIIGVSSAMVFVSMFSIIITYITCRHIDLKLNRYLFALKPAIYSTLFMLVGLFLLLRFSFLAYWDEAYRLLIGFMIGSGLYLIFFKYRFKVDFFEFYDFLKNLFKS